MEELFLESLSRYYGLDWVTLVFGIVGMYLISKKSPSGFIIAAVGNATGIITAYLALQIAYIFYNVIVGYIMYNGWRNWQEDERIDDEPMTTVSLQNSSLEPSS